MKDIKSFIECADAEQLRKLVEHLDTNKRMPELSVVLKILISQLS